MSRRHSDRRAASERPEPVNPLYQAPAWRPDRKALQLSRQVREALSWVLGTATGDDRLAACSVEAVEPLPGGHRLLVKVGVPPDLPPSEVTERLAAAAPVLRTEVAQSITRRKVPELVYLAVPAAV
jgi:ribosome-binding factor A